MERNYRCRQGEIDIIATDQEYLVFIEVKRRNADRYGEASASVTLSKQRKICSVSDVYRYRKRISEDRPIRYDVVAINDNHIKIIKNAFNYR